MLFLFSTIYAKEMSNFEVKVCFLDAEEEWILIYNALLVRAVLLEIETTDAESYLRAVLLISIICWCDTVSFHSRLAHLILFIPCGLFMGGGYGVILVFKIFSTFAFSKVLKLPKF